MNLNAILAVDESQDVVTGYRMTTAGEDIHANGLFRDNARLLLVKVLTNDQELWRIVFLFLLSFVQERHKLAPTRRTAFFLLAMKNIKVFVAEDNGALAQSLKEVLMFGNIVEVRKFVYNSSREFHVVFDKPVIQCLLAFLLYLPTLSSEHSLYFALCLCRGHEINPCGLHMLGVGSENLDLIAALELMTQRHKLMVDLCANTMAAQEGMDLKSKVEDSTACRQCLDLTLGSKDKDLGREQVELH